MCDEIVDLFSNTSHATKRHILCQIDENCDNRVSLGETVCYIVGAVLVNDQGEILLIQEAKSSCRGSWYLPAGRVERDETLVDAVKREVQEESGFIFEPSGLICVEENGGRWMRFIFAGAIVGGTLKTADKADSESLQAAWIKDITSVNLRARDILQSIEYSKNYYKQKKSNVDCRRLNVSPLYIPHAGLFVRSLILFHVNDSTSYALLFRNLSYDQQYTMPVSCLKLHHSINTTVQRVLNAALRNPAHDSWSADVIGVVNVEHTGNSKQRSDGICLTILASLLSNKGEGVLPPLNDAHAMWQKLDLNSMQNVPNLFKLKEQKVLCVPVVSYQH